LGRYRLRYCFLERRKREGTAMEQKKASSSTNAVASISDTVAKGRDGIGDAASEAMDSASSDLKALRDDLNGLKDTVGKFISQTSGHATRTAYDVAGQLGTAAHDLADNTGASSMVHEVEGWTRRNPLGAIAAAVMVGLAIGMLGR
jgi:ElaB/YqjD/DUF883 family membrane-anchored ribosome-binding protein